MNFESIQPDFNHHLSSHVFQAIGFRPMDRVDAFPLFEATRDPQFNSFLLWDAPEDVHGVVIQVEKLLRDHRQRRVVATSLVETSTGIWKGFMVHKGYRDGMEMSLYIHPDSWNSKAMMCAASAALEISHQHFPGVEVYNRVKNDNLKMLKICRGSGFERIDEENLTHQTGRVVPVEVFRLNRAKWKRFNGLQNF